MRRTLWYVCIGLVCVLLGVAVLQAAGVVNVKKADNKKAPEVVSMKPKASRATLAARTQSATGDLAVTEKQQAYDLYQRMLNGEQMTSSEKVMIDQWVGVPQHDRTNPLDNTGGPDASGYRFKDNVTPDTATYNWIELRGDAGATFISGWGSYDDGMSPASYPIGFSFPFYSSNYTTFEASSNGQIEFGPTYSPYSYTSCLSATTTYGPAIMPYMADLHLQHGGDATGNTVVGYKNFGTYTVIEFDSVGYFSSSYTGSSMKFEVILYNNGSIKLQYNNIVLVGSPAPSMATVGILSGTTAANSFLQYRCYSDGNTVKPLTNGLAIWFYRPAGLLDDFACSGITSPSGQQFVNANATVTATFVNAGQTTESSPVKYQFNGGGIVTEATASLAQYGTESHSFATQITMPATPGTYTLTVWSDLPGDLDHTNDTARVNITVRGCFNVDLGSGFVSVTGQTNCGLGNTYSNTCLGLYDGGEDMTYKWTCTTEGDYLFRMDPHGTTYPGMLLSNHCPPDSQCIRDTLNASAVVLSFCQHLTPGDYYIMVDTWPAPNCIPNFDFSIGDCGVGRCCYGDPTNPTCADNSNAACTALNGTWTAGINCTANPCPPRPANDNCGWVTPVTLPATFTGNVNNATHDCSLITTGTGEVWHAFTTTACMNVTLDFCNTPASWNTFATALYSGCPCASAIYSTTSDYSTCANGNITIHWNLLAPGTYYYPVYLYPTSGDSGVYSINATAVACPPPPANDLCANAISLSGNVSALAWDNTYAVSAAENTACSLGTMYHDIWYCWSTTCEVDVNVSICGSTFDTKLAVLNTDANCTCPAPTTAPIVCNDDTCGLQSAVSFHAMPGKYLIQVGSYSATGGGAGVLTVNTSAPCACDSVTAVTVYSDPNVPGHEWLHFNAPSTSGSYHIYVTTNKNNDGDPRNNDPNFTLAGTLIASAVGQQVWQDTSATGTYKNYVVIHDCSTIGRCCYGDPMSPSCAVNTSAQCAALSGIWTSGGDCNTACPLPSYCAGGSGDCDSTSAGESIGNVTVGTINNSSYADLTTCYNDYTTMSTPMVRGTGYPIAVTITNWYATDTISVWVDWNHNFDWSDAGELIPMTSNGNVEPVIFSATITPPAGATVGNTRMRVRLQYGGNPVPCGDTSYGEVEDYTVQVQ
jgi:hypothetical protein